MWARRVGGSENLSTWLRRLHIWMHCYVPYTFIYICELRKPLATLSLDYLLNMQTCDRMCKVLAWLRVCMLSFPFLFYGRIGRSHGSTEAIIGPVKPPHISQRWKNKRYPQGRLTADRTLRIPIIGTAGQGYFNILIYMRGKQKTCAVKIPS